MFKKIILVTDLSDNYHEIIKNLRGMKNFGTEEFLILQCISNQIAISSAISYDKNILEKDLAEQKKLLEKQGFKVDTRIITGDAKHHVNRIAEEENYSMILAGAEEYKKFSDLFSSSIAYEIIHFASKPVYIIRMGITTVNGEQRIKCISCNIDNHILFPTDFSETADHAFLFLTKMVKSGVKKVTLFHVQDKGRIAENSDSLEKYNKIDFERLSKLKERLLKHADIDVNIRINYGIPFVEIDNIVNELKIQLVIMGSSGRGFIKGLFLGSVSDKVAKKVDASVLLVPGKN